jgi:poly-gamma-glutamate synthesis protein (capsule biosynthesis protein)
MTEIRCKKRFKIIIGATAVVGCLVAFLFVFGGQADSGDPGDLGKAGEDIDIAGLAIEEELLPPVSLLISGVGDIMDNRETDTYDFNNNFAYVKKYFEESDLSIGNLETTFAGPPYAGWPLFSAPDELAPALKNAGFDVIVTANNHMIDRGLVGLLRTIDVLRGSGLIVSGSRPDDTQPRYAIFEAQGVKIAVVAYTYGTSSAAGNRYINGIRASAETVPLMNYFRYSHLDEDLANVKQTVDAARAAGADIIVMYYHWGDEYMLTSNQWQRTIAERTVNDMDVDMIFGSHPHTLQEAVYLTNIHNGKQVPVFYSMGNFISNQRRETLPNTRNNRHTETGIIAQVRIEFDINNREIISISKDAVPTWVEKYRSGGRDVYAIIPLDDALDANTTLAVSGNLRRAERAWEDANGILGIN